MPTTFNREPEYRRLVKHKSSLVDKLTKLRKTGDPWQDVNTECIIKFTLANEFISSYIHPIVIARMKIIARINRWK